jgi:hypothetical protein
VYLVTGGLVSGGLIGLAGGRPVAPRPIECPDNLGRSLYAFVNDGFMLKNAVQ